MFFGLVRVLVSVQIGELFHAPGESPVEGVVGVLEVLDAVLGFCVTKRKLKNLLGWVENMWGIRAGARGYWGCSGVLTVLVVVQLAEP